MNVGWRLAEEIAWARPERPGPEWWTLLDIAQDASDETRRAWPGHEYLMARAKRSRRTVDRYLSLLAAQAMITVVVAAAPGRRAVYEIPVIRTCVTNAGTRTCATNADTRLVSAQTDVRQKRMQRAPKTDATCATNDGAPSVSTSVTTPVNTQGPDFTPAVEHARERSGQDRISSMTALEAAAWNAVHPEGT